MAAAAPSQRPDLNPERADSHTKPRITHGVQYDRSTPRRLAVGAVKTQQALVAAVAEEGVKEAPKDFIVPSIDAVKPRTRALGSLKGLYCQIATKPLLPNCRANGCKVSS